MALKKLNEDLRRAKKKKTKKPAPKMEAPVPIDFDPLVKAIEGMQQPVVNIKQEPVGYNITVNLNSRGDMVGAKILPMKE